MIIARFVYTVDGIAIAISEPIGSITSRILCQEPPTICYIVSRSHVNQTRLVILLMAKIRTIAVLRVTTAGTVADHSPSVITSLVPDGIRIRPKPRQRRDHIP